MIEKDLLISDTLPVVTEDVLPLPNVDLTEKVEERYRKAKEFVLSSLRKASGRSKMAPISEVLLHFGITIPPNPSEAQISEYQMFLQDIYPAVERLKDLRARTIEALHAKKLKTETTANLTSLLKTVTGDIDTIENGKKGSGEQKIFNIQINTEEFNNIISSYTEKKGIKDKIRDAE